MSTITYAVRVLRADGSPLRHFTAEVYMKHVPDGQMLPPTELHVDGDPAPLSIEIPDQASKPGLVFLNLRGPADPARPDVLNYLTEIRLYRRTGGPLDFVFDPCPRDDLFDGTSVCAGAPLTVESGATEAEAGIEEVPETEEVAAAAPGSADYFPGHAHLRCARVNVGVRDADGAVVDCYKAHLSIHSMPPLTNCAELDPVKQKHGFRVPATTTSTFVYLHESGTDRFVTRAEVRPHQGDSSVIFALGERPPTPPPEPQVHYREIDAPAAQMFYKHGTGDTSKSGEAKAVRDRCDRHGADWARQNLDMDAVSGVRVQAYWNRAAGFFVTGEVAHYQWKAFYWTEEDGQGAEVPFDQISVDGLLMRWLQ